MTARHTRRAALALLFAVITPTGRAHEGPHADGIGVAVDRTSRVEGGGLEVDITLTNVSSEALTLRAVECLEAKATRLLRRSSLLGVELWNPVKLLRLDPGDQVRLGPPDYVIEIDGAPAGEDLLTLRLDFGPAGETTVVLFVTD